VGRNFKQTSDRRPSATGNHNEPRPYRASL